MLRINLGAGDRVVNKKRSRQTKKKIPALMELAF